MQALAAENSYTDRGSKILNSWDTGVAEEDNKKEGMQASILRLIYAILLRDQPRDIIPIS